MAGINNFRAPRIIIEKHLEEFVNDSIDIIPNVSTTKLDNERNVRKFLKNIAIQ